MHLISVITPVWKIDKYFSQTLNSIDEQTLRSFIVIFVVRECILGDLENILINSQIHFDYLIISTKLDGVAFAANLGIAEVKTPYVARWDADDLCDSNRFEVQVQEMELNPKLAIVGTKVILIDGDNQEIKFQKYKFFGTNEEVRRSLRYRCSLLHSSLLMRTEVLFKNRGYLYGNHSEDHELFIRIARDSCIEFKNINNSITYYRRHPNQLSDKSSKKDRKDSFCDVSGFLFSEFLRTGHPAYIFGMLVILPVSRRLRYYFREVLQFVYKRINF